MIGFKCPSQWQKALMKDGKLRVVASNYIAGAGPCGIVSSVLD